MPGNPRPSRPFVKGDPRINRKGRPKNLSGFRQLAKRIGHELALDPATQQPITFGDEAITVAEKLLYEWANSDNPVLQKAFIEYAFGKVPEHGILETLGDMTIRIVNSANIPEAPREDEESIDDFEEEDNA